MTGEMVSNLLVILTIVSIVLLIGFMVGNHIYKRKHNLPTGECASCHINTQKILKEYHKMNAHE